MGLLRAIKERFGSNDQVVQLYNCDGCSNVFTKTWQDGEPRGEVTCPNCGSNDVEMTVESP